MEKWLKIIRFFLIVPCLSFLKLVSKFKFKQCLCNKYFERLYYDSFPPISRDSIIDIVLSFPLLQPKELDRSQDTAVREGAHHHRWVYWMLDSNLTTSSHDLLERIIQFTTIPSTSNQHRWVKSCSTSRFRWSIKNR